MMKKKGKLVDILFSYEGNKKIESKAITRFKVIDSNNHYSLLELYPETGRKHQLRKQLLIHGYPVLGDSKYRISEKTKIKDNNLMLHAHKLSFSIDNIKYNFYRFSCGRDFRLDTVWGDKARTDEDWTLNRGNLRKK